MTFSNTLMVLFAFVGYRILSVIIAFFAQWLVKDYQTSQHHIALIKLFANPPRAYPFLISFLTISFYLISFSYPYPQNLAYLCFTSILAISLFTDAFALLISQIFTLYLIPLAWIAAYFGLIPLTFTESFYASLLAYGLLKITYAISFKLMKKESMGSGDTDLFAFIAAWVGFYGSWFVLTVGSSLGALYGIICLLRGKDKNTLQLPFGSFLCLGTIIYLLWSIRSFIK